MRIGALGALVCLLGVGPAAAQSVELEAVNPGMIVSSDDALPKETFRAGGTTIDVRASRRVDVSSLMVAARIRPNDDPQTVVDKVNVVRKRLYPDEEISLITTAPPRTGVTQGVSLYKSYVYWNRSGAVNWWWNSMSVGVTFMDDVLGDWNYYECNNCSTWKYLYRVRTGQSLTRVLYSGYRRRGFNYVPRVKGSRADIVMYFLY